MGTIGRREALQILAATPAAAVLTWLPRDVDAATQHVNALRGGQFEPQFFTPHEYRTVRLLVDLIIPRDQRSGSATDAGVPEFMDFIVNDQEGRQTAMRGGLAWLDTECRERFANDFVECTDEEQRNILDTIAWPSRAPESLSQGVAFFNSFRDLTATGFWSSKMGVEDLRYMGNRAIPEWTGCPPEQLRKLGLE